MPLVYLVAAGIGYVGWRFGRRNPLWGQILQGGAAAVAYLATYVGGHAYGLFSETTTLGLFAALSAALVWRAVREDAKVLAGVGFLGAYAAPVLAIQAQQSLLFNLVYGILTCSTCSVLLSTCSVLFSASESIFQLPSFIYT